MSLPDTKVWGEKTFMLQPSRPVRRAREVHQLSDRWQCETKDYFKLGDAHPHYPGMRVVSVDEKCEIVDEAYEVALESEGIADEGVDFLDLDFSERQPDEGWDEVRVRIFTREPDAERWRKGARIQSNASGVIAPGYENLYIVDRGARKHRAAGYWELELLLKGLKEEKPFRRRINGAVTTTSTRFTGAMVSTKYVDYPPTSDGTASLSGSDLEVEVDAAGVTVSDTMLWEGDPPTEIIGGFWAPPDPPGVTFSVPTGEATKYFFPWGWKCVSMNAERLPVDGVTLWLVTFNFIYQPATMPTTAAA